jgi:hypothetical protein
MPARNRRKPDASRASIASSSVVPITFYYILLRLITILLSLIIRETSEENARSRRNIAPAFAEQTNDCDDDVSHEKSDSRE